MIPAIAFYVFASITLLSAVMVIMARNPVHSVLFLILAFFNSAGLFVLLGAEFIAMILVIVYVGAVAVLFLFVVMMLNIDIKNSRKDFMQQYVPIGLLTGGILLFELISIAMAWYFAEGSISNIAAPTPDPQKVTNTEALGQILYTDYIFAFQTAGLILLVAMIGAIVLTHRRRPGVRKQNVASQQARTQEDAMEIKKVTPKTGI